MNKGRFFKIFLIALIFVLGLIVAYLLFANATANVGLKKFSREKESEFQREAAAIKDEAKREMNARYDVSDVHFEDVTKKIEVEKKRSRELLEKTKKKIK